MLNMLLSLDDSGLEFPLQFETLEDGYIQWHNDWNISARPIRSHLPITRIDESSIRTLWPRNGNIPYGWLSPEGRFYNAPLSGHHIAAVMIHRFVAPFAMGNTRWTSDRITQLGWMHVDRFDGCRNSNTHVATQAQLDWMFDYDKRSLKYWQERAE